MVPQPKPMSDALKKKLGISLTAQGTYLDLGPAQVELLTAGWTDEQIQAKSMDEIDAMIRSGEQGLASLRTTVSAEEDRIGGLRQIRNRKLSLGG